MAKDKNPTKFKFYTKNNKHIWKNNEFKVVFSNSSFQAFDEYAQVKSIKDIMYLYYDVSVYFKKTKYTKNGKKKKKWKEVATTSAYDFPTIEQFLHMLDTMLHKDIELDKCRKIIYYVDNNGLMEPSGKVGYEYSLESEGFDADDYYQLTRLLIRDEDDSFIDGEENQYGIEMRHDIDRESFNLYFGTGKLNRPFSSIGIKYSRIERDDLEELYNCVQSFLDSTIETHNKNVMNCNKKSIESLYVEDNILFKKALDNDKAIESIYIKDDICDITIASDDILNDDMYSIDYHNTKITNINKDSITVIDGYFESRNNCKYEPIKEEIVIPIDKILHIFADLDVDSFINKLHYNEDEIVDDFLAICNNDMKKDFKEMSTEDLFNKYNSAIADRVWIYREEHSFAKYSDDRDKNIELILNIIIEKIKNKNIV